VKRKCCLNKTAVPKIEVVAFIEISVVAFVMYLALFGSHAPSTHCVPQEYPPSSL
jgi:hypothetical protein